MAPAEWEIKLFKFTEGTDNFYINQNSFKNDLKPPFKLFDAIEWIKKNPLYDSFDEVSKWLFCPSSETQLQEELAELLIEYQSYRNGHKEKICKIKSNEEFELLNESLRAGFIRDNHHIRIERYVKNLSKVFEQKIEQAAWGKQLARDLAKICRSHCEDISYIDNLDVNSHYYGKETANLQMVAMLLRLGDIIHFSFDRAPIEIRAAKVFESSYSFNEWAVKNNGVNYTIERGLISFKAFCESPKDYFRIHEYIDWIDIEVQNYFRFERRWNTEYIPELKEKVCREGVRHDEDVFYPVRDLKFKLNQKKILELLMGVGLYKDKYSCLRELYQNSLDACRCLKSSSSSEILNSITFGLERNDEGVYLYCQDDGIGMTKNIIEDYLLNIGNSYYKSSDFFKKQAQWNGSFTPTSQFGIGILSCFMIGSRIDITTKSTNDEVISCAIDGPHESFYYKSHNKLDAERIGSSGTIVRVLLLNSCEDEILTTDLLYPELVQLSSHVTFDRGDFNKYKSEFKIWENHLFNKINDLVCSPTLGVQVKVKLESGATIEVGDKPYAYNKIESVTEDLPFIDYLISGRYFKTPRFKYSEVTPTVEKYKVFAEYQGVQATTLIVLPKNNFPFDDLDALNVMPLIGNYGVCIDGITISNNVSIEREIEYLSAIERVALLNFTGNIRPQLSVDRKSVTSWPDGLSPCMNVLSERLANSIIDSVKKHINFFSLSSDGREVIIIWKYIFEKFEFLSSFLIKGLLSSDVGGIHWQELNELCVDSVTIQRFIDAKSITIKSPNNVRKSKVTEQILLGKLLTSDSVLVNGSEITISAEQRFKSVNLSRPYGIRDNEILILSSWDETIEFDLISEVLPVIPKKLFVALQKGDDSFRGTINEIGIKIPSFSNGIGAFFNQDPLMIHESLGIYSNDRVDSSEAVNNKVYCFVNRITGFWLSEINSHESIFKQKRHNVLFVFISPRPLSQAEEIKLAEISEKDPSYVKGVREGWSILFTGMKNQNSIIKAGVQSRSDMVRELSDSFWMDYEEHSFWFLDGTEMKKY